MFPRIIWLYSEKADGPQNLSRIVTYDQNSDTKAAFLVECEWSEPERRFATIMVQDFFKNLTKMALKTFLDLKIMWQLKSKKIRGCQISPY